MPAVAEPSPLVGVRERVLAYARRQVAVPAAPVASVWGAIRAFLAPVSLGVGAALVVLALLHWRGAVALVGRPEALPVSVFFAAGLAVVLGGLLRGAVASSARAVLVGALAAVGGYVVLTLISPIGETVRFCRLRLLGDAAMSMGELCLLYAGVAILYGGIPMGIAVYVWGGRVSDRRAGAVEAAIFVTLVAPILLLQSAPEGWVIALSVLVALALGSFAGGLAGSLARLRRPAHVRS